MTSLIAHQKQFLLGPRAVRLRPDWISIELAPRLILSHCPKLKVTPLQSKDGAQFYVLGLGVLANRPGATIRDAVSGTHSEEIENWTGFWAGRWAVISASACWQDAAGCFGLYYRSTQNGLWISNSPALLGDHVPGETQLPRIPWTIKHGKGMDWIPLPLSTRENVYKLLPLRRIDPRTSRIEPIRFRAPTSQPSDPQLLANTLKTIMANWGGLPYRKRLVGLTAGLDTRSALAAAMAAKLDIETYTFDSRLTARKDRLLPPRIAAKVGLKHNLLGPLDLPTDDLAEREAIMTEHMDGAAQHPISMTCATGRAELMHDGATTIAAGNAFEVGRCIFWFGRMKPRLPANLLRDPDDLLGHFFEAPLEPSAYWRHALQMWLDSLAEPIALDLEWRDRLYLEQRLGGWCSNVQRALDVLDGTYFYPGNCLWVFHQLMQYDPWTRSDGYAQKEAIRLLCPTLAQIPINPVLPSVRIGRVADRLLGAERARKLKDLVNSTTRSKVANQGTSS